jgi:hypothetical protein
MENGIERLNIKRPQENLGEQFRQRLEIILGGTISVENIDTFTIDVLDFLIVLTDDVVAAYTPEEGSLSGEALENAAFQHYQLQNIGEVLETAQKKLQQIRDIKKFVDEASDNTPEIITPPDGVSRQGDEESSTFEVAGYVPRLTMLFYLLENDLGIPKEETVVVRGSVNSQIMRTKPYYRVEVPELERIVYICDEERNASYVFDRAVVQQHGMTAEQLDVMTKEERNELIGSIAGIGRRIVQNPAWRQHMAELLSEGIPAYIAREYTPSEEAIEAREENVDAPVVSTAELDPWHGYWEDEYGTHWAPVRKLATYFGVSNQALARRITPHEEMLTKIRVKTPPAKRTWDAYCLEELLSFEEFTKLAENNKVERKGEWAGFYIDEQGLHYGTLDALADKVGLSRDKTSAFLEQFSVRTRKVRNKNQEEREAYCYEDFVNIPEVKKDIETPLVETSGEWAGYFINPDTGQHWGPIGNLADSLGLNWMTVQRRLPPGLSSRRVKDTLKHVQDAYCYEEVSQLPAIIQAQQERLAKKESPESA